jgi:predicted TIM-barrel fold metal-dependent hydrolase
VLGDLCVKAYNDWMLDEWCAGTKDRLIPLIIVQLWDPNLAAAEVRRNAARGCHAVTFSEIPAFLGLPSMHDKDGFWDPFLQACEETDTVVCMHIGSSSSTPFTSPDAPFDVSIAISPINLFQTAADLVWSPIFTKFPGLEVALSEGGIGWIPYFMERADWVYERQRGWTGADLHGKRPSDVIREHVITCFIDDKVGLGLREQIGIDNMCWECDYPHSDSTWPQAPEVLWESIRDLPIVDIDRITHANAMRHFQFDPFGTIARDQANVASLRAQATDVDLTFTAPRRARNSTPPTGDFNRVFLGAADALVGAPGDDSPEGD